MIKWGRLPPFFSSCLTTFVCKDCAFCREINHCLLVFTLICLVIIKREISLLNNWHHKQYSHQPPICSISYLALDGEYIGLQCHYVMLRLVCCLLVNIQENKRTVHFDHKGMNEPMEARLLECGNQHK